MLLRVALALTICLGLPGCIYYLNPECTDLIRNGEETDVDCGGVCGPCAIGDRCTVNADCEDSTCNDGRCTPLPCANGVQDEMETDVDCGGGTCRKCAGQRACEANTDCFSGTCVPGAKVCSGLANVAFADQVPYESGSKTYNIFSADFDGDGDIDIAAANEQDSNMSIFINNGSGVFSRLGLFPTGVYPTGGAIADFNRDGIPDLVTADYRGDSVSVLLGLDNGMGKGSGMFAAKTTYPTVGGSETSNLAVGDLDNDGNVDVVATNPLASSVSQFMGKSDGTLEAAINVPIGIDGGSAPYSTAIGDYNGDGNADLAVADVQRGIIVVRLGNGDRTFQEERLYVVAGVPPYIMTTRDVDVDGKLDLISANRGSDDVSVLLGRGDGTFRRAIVSPTGEDTGPYSVGIADFNLDGVPDIVTPNYKASTSSVLLGIGNGTYEAPINAGATGVITYGVTAADFNGDGKPDFATANANTNNMTVKLNGSN